MSVVSHFVLSDEFAAIFNVVLKMFILFSNCCS